MTEEFDSHPTTNGSVAATAPEDNKTAAPAGIADSLIVTHLSSYPTLKAAYSYALSFSLVQGISTHTAPYYEAAKGRSKPVVDPLLKRASPLLKRADELGDGILSAVDKRIPHLKTTKPDDVVDVVRRPIEAAYDFSGSYVNAARDRYNTQIIKPLQDATESLKTQYNAVYDTRGKPLIKARIDPYLGPVNKELEKFINAYLPEGTEIGTSDTEIAHTIQIALSALGRVRPAIGNQATAIAALPKETRAHVQEVYEAKRSEYSKGNSPVSSTVYASLATWKQLSSEGATFAGSVLHAKSSAIQADGIVVN